MRGTTVKTPERVAEATRLRDVNGWSWQRIADHFGVQLQTARNWVLDPDGVETRKRKAQYRLPCVGCGNLTNPGGPLGDREPRCVSCNNTIMVAARRVWTSATVISAIQDWTEKYGSPPGAADWNAWQSRHRLHDDARAVRAEKDRAAQRYPCHTTVVEVFGSWNAAITAAGFEPRAAAGTKANVARRRDQRAKAEA